MTRDGKLVQLNPGRKWGITESLELANWHQMVVDDAVPLKDARRNVVIRIQNEAGEEKAAYEIVKAWPCKYDPSDLNGKGNGAVRNYFKPSGQCQESGRDQAHTQMGLNFLACTCEIAWNQGVDIYGAYDNRLLKGFEYTAKFNLGFDVPYEPYRSFEGRYHYKSISDDSRGRLQPIYEKVLNHYENRKGLEAEFTRQVVMKLREGSDGRRSRGRRSSPSGSSALGTLMFSGQVHTMEIQK